MQSLFSLSSACLPYLYRFLGGSGALAYTACQCFPKTKITVFDLPPVIELAPHFKPRLEDCPNQVNVEFKAGDFLTVTSELPKADLYILTRILHDWDNKHVDVILSKVFDSLPSGNQFQMAFCFLLFYPFNFQHQTANSPFLLPHITYGRDG